MIVTVFAGSRLSSDSAIIDGARRVGLLCTQLHHTLAFGGTGQGLMSVAAKATLDSGGIVLGVYCDSLYAVEPPMAGLTRMESFPTLAARRSRLIEVADLIVALPGGVGTLDEFFEAVALRSLGLLNAEVVLLNLNGFFDPLIAQIDLQRRGGLMPADADWIRICQTPEEVFRLPDQG